MGRSSKLSSTQDCIERFRATAKQSINYHDKWLSDENWVLLINSHFENDLERMTTQRLNPAFSRHSEYKDLMDPNQPAANGTGKNKYRGLPLSAKRSKETFRKSVKGCISRDYIDLAACRKFSRRARQYMVAYKAIADGASLGDIEDGTSSADMGDRATPIKVQKIIQACKNHRCAMDFDHKFIVSVSNTNADPNSHVTPRREVSVLV
jgi:hypothetical protein